MRGCLVGSVALLLLGLPAAQAQVPAPMEIAGPPAAFAEGASDTWALPAAADPPGACPRVWLDASYLLMWFKRSPEPVPLVTTASLTDPLPGALGQPGTRVVLGGSSIEPGVHSGARFTAGYWLDGERCWAVEGGYFFLAQRSVQQAVSTTGLPGSGNFAVPYFDVTGAAGLNGVPGESIYVVPGPFTPLPGFAGTITRTLTTRLQGAEANGLGNLYRGPCGLRLDAVAGFRWLELQEDLSLAVQTLGLAGSGSAGQFYNTLDSFRVRNSFYGGQVGAQAEYQAGRWFVRARTTVALGDMHEAGDVNGIAQTSKGNLFFSTGGRVSQPFAGGVFAQPSNIGRHVRDRFAVVPEETIALGWQPWEWLRVTVGYTFLYASAVARPGDQIDRDINATRTGLADAIRSVGLGTAASGPVAPAFTFHDSSFWAQGIRFGLEVRF
jgi:hypothetical protein